MLNMTTYKQGQVVLVPFPMTDLEGTKQRPAVVVSAYWYNTSRPDCILVAVTSAVPQELDRDMVSIHGAEVKDAGLRQPSVVKAGKIFTVEQDRILKPLGKLSRGSLERVLAGMRAAISDS